MDNDNQTSDLDLDPTDVTATKKKKKSSSVIWILIAVVVVIIVLIVIGVIIWLIVRNSGGSSPTPTPSPTLSNGSLCTASSDCLSGNCAPNGSGIGLNPQLSYCQPLGITNSGVPGAVCSPGVFTNQMVRSLCGNPYICNPQTGSCMTRVVPIPLQQNPPAQSVILANQQCYRQGTNTTWTSTNQNQVVGWMAINLSQTSIPIFVADMCVTCTGSGTTLTCSSGIDVPNMTESPISPGSTVLWTDTLNSTTNQYRLPPTQANLRFIGSTIQIDITDPQNITVVQSSQSPLKPINNQQQWYLFIILPEFQGQIVVLRRAMGTGQVDTNIINQYVKLAQNLLQ